MTETPCDRGGGRRKELILDTKGICFLCLDKPEIIMTTGSTSPLGLREVCLRNICRYLSINQCAVLMKGVNVSGGRNGEKTKGLPVFALNKDSVNCDFDFSVLLCENCASLTEELSLLIRQLEMIKMIMGSHLRTFHQVLMMFHNSKGPNGLSRLQQVQEIMSVSQDNHNLEEVRLVEYLRLETAEKCSAKVAKLTTSCVPMVRLDRCDEVKQSKVGKATAVLLPDQTPVQNHDIAVSSLKLGIMEDNGQNHGVKSDSTRNWILKQFSNYSEKLHQQNRSKCVLCGQTLHQSNIRVHLVCFHTEKFFANTKLSRRVSNQQFKIWCQEILFTEGDISNGSAEHREHRARAKQCIHCHQRYSDSYHLRYHLVLEHYNILKEKLIQKQKRGNDYCTTPTDPGPVLPRRPASHQITQECSKDAGKLNGIVDEVYKLWKQKSFEPKMEKRIVWKCLPDKAGQGCGGLLSSRKGLMRHRRYYCANRDPIHKTDWICYIQNGGCGRRVSSQQSLQRHRKKTCAVRKGFRSTFELFDDGNAEASKNNTNAIEVVSLVRKCSDCGASFDTRNALRVHKINVCHRNIGNSKNLNALLPKVITDMPVEKSGQPITSNGTQIWTCGNVGERKGCGRKFCSALALSKHKNEHCPRKNVNYGSNICTETEGGCGGIYSSNYTLVRHQITSCPAIHARKGVERTLFAEIKDLKEPEILQETLEARAMPILEMHVDSQLNDLTSFLGIKN